MTGTIDLTPDGETLLVRFPYREDLVEDMRTIQGRRWDRGGKVWKVPVKCIDAVVDTFLRHGFALAPEVSSLLAGTAGSAASANEPDSALAPTETNSDPEADTAAQPALSLSILNERVRSSVRGAFPDPIWVTGEVLDFDKSQRKRHVFFTLVEKRAGQDEPAAQAEVALFARTAERLTRKLDNPENPLALRDGIEIRVLVRVDLYPTSGRYQLIIEDIDPSFTLGKMALSREQILAELRTRGLDQRNAELPIPTPPLRVAVLTSLESDGWSDFLAQLESSGLGFQVTCYSMRVQGRELRPTMLRGLEWFAERREEHDVLCVLRGGGSRTDLAWFDDRDLAFAIATHPLKVLCGIGHQRDRSVLDAITHSEKTPTAVGALLVDCVRGAQQALGGLARTLSTRTGHLLREQAHRTGTLGRSLLRVLERRLDGDRRQLTESGKRVARGTAGLLERRRARTQQHRGRLTNRSLLTLERAGSRLARQLARQRLLDPVRVLQRGYAVLRGPDGAIVTGVASLRPGATIEVSLRDGRVRATTDEIIEDNGES